MNLDERLRLNEFSPFVRFSDFERHSYGNALFLAGSATIVRAFSGVRSSGRS
jgi:hypothetical protein